MRRTERTYILREERLGKERIRESTDKNRMNMGSNRQKTENREQREQTKRKKIGIYIGSAIEKGLDLIYPRRCPICQTIPPDGRRICKECEEQLVYVEEPFCMKCGKPLQQEEERREYCSDCQRLQRSFERNYGLLLYNEVSKKSMYAFKYQNKREFADWYIESFLHQNEWRIRQIGIQAVIPVPIHRVKRRKRGYNQAELLAVCLAKKLELPCLRHGLVRIVDTKPQKELDPMERNQNLKKAFVVGKQLNQYDFESVLLVDDIYTTGATMETCTRVLKEEAGISMVYGCTICVGRGY